MLYDEKGRELPDPTPVAMPSGVGRPEPLHETIKRMVRVQLSDYARTQGKETFEESLDFEIEDDEIEHQMTHSEKRAEMIEEYLYELGEEHARKTVEQHKERLQNREKKAEKKEDDKE